jgi:biotin transport system substrate-specific component
MRMAKTSARTLILPDTAFRREALARDLALIAVFSLAIAAAAQIRIPLPWTPVPITAQTFVVGLAGILLGARRGALAALFYLAMGGAGAPFFSGAQGGISVLAGVTGGYLIGMPLGAALAGLLAERGFERHPAGAFAAMLCSSLVILFMGTLGLSHLAGSVAIAVTQGFIPFIAGEAFKAAAAAALLPSLWLLRRRDED